MTLSVIRVSLLLTELSFLYILVVRKRPVRPRQLIITIYRNLATKQQVPLQGGESPDHLQGPERGVKGI
jgi:hypothetical protein